MKRVIITGRTVENVEAVPDDAAALIVADDVYVGPGMIWNGNHKKPVFENPLEPEATD